MVIDGLVMKWKPLVKNTTLFVKNTLCLAVVCNFITNFVSVKPFFIMKLSRTLTFLTIAAAAMHMSAHTTVSWSSQGNIIGSDGKPAYVQKFTVTGDTDIDGVAFNQFARRMKMLSSGDSLIEIVPGYYRIDSPRFGQGADTVELLVETYGVLRSICYAPDGIHAVKAGKPAPTTFFRSDITASPQQWVAPWGEDVMPYGDFVYGRNQALADGEVTFYSVIPSFKSVKMTREMPSPFRRIECVETDEFSRAGQWRAIINDGVVTVEASKEDMPLALRRLNALDFKSGTAVPGAVIEDWPDFPYRGVMIDIARNYQSPAELDRVLDLMARYGLNVLHFHFADDEAWRLEIPGLPELTEVGARRGYTTNEHDYMAQIFAGDGNPDSAEGSANGFFTRADFVKMLAKADSLGIIVIPEVESPGHARAAIKAMEKRFRATGDDTFCLIDRADTSVYTSAQSFHDNVMNPVLPGPVKFMTHVASELKKMYREAGISMPALHIGGDEVAKGAWTGSPLARAYMDSVGMTNERLLHLKYVRELLEELNALDIPVSGWQEIAVGHDNDYNSAVRPHVFSVNCWSTLGDQNSVTAQSARAGYPTVLSNVDHFYLDMCYSPHPYERGLSWGGYVDEFDALHGYPRRLCAVDDSAFTNVIGVQGQLFAETMRSPQMLESFLLPKMLGLAERAWNADSTYTDSDFNAVVKSREIPYWVTEGYTFHVPQPGIEIDGGLLKMNTQYDCGEPVLEIHYTTDGSNPDSSSPVYVEPVALPAGCTEVRALATHPSGVQSVVSILYVK